MRRGSAVLFRATARAERTAMAAVTMAAVTMAVIAMALIAIGARASGAQGPMRPDVRDALSWRPIGPFRGGRT